MGKLKKQDLKKWGILFLILLVPSIILLKCNKGKHNFTTLSIVANPFSSTNMKFLDSDKSVLLDQDSVVFNKTYVSGKINIICFFLICWEPLGLMLHGPAQGPCPEVS